MKADAEGSEAYRNVLETPAWAPVVTTSRDASSGPKLDPDEALRTAIKAALDAGDVERARSLLDMLAPLIPRSGGAVVSLATRRKP